MKNDPTRSLEEQRISFNSRRFLAMPLAGLMVWLSIGISSLFTTTAMQNIWILFIGTGCIAYLGMFISRYTGENFMDKSKPKNTFDTLFFSGVLMAVLVYSIALPFFIVDYTSLPLSVGILTGLMWVPLSWIIQHWVGLFHTLCRTVFITFAWYYFPQQRFTIIPFIIVLMYFITIVVLELRWRALRRTVTTHALMPTHAV